MKYYNPITKEETLHPYRFKTEKEFEEEYGGDWTGLVPQSWSYGDDEMNVFFGKNIDCSDEEIKLLLGERNESVRIYDPIYNNTWYISGAMITPNGLNPNFENLYRPKTNIYEGILKFNEYKKGNN